MILVNAKEQARRLDMIANDIGRIFKSDPREGLEDDIKESIDVDDIRKKDVETDLIDFTSLVLKDEYERLMESYIFHNEGSKKILLYNAVEFTDLYDLKKYIENVCILTGMKHSIFYSETTRNGDEFSEKEYEIARRIRNILLGSGY